MVSPGESSRRHVRRPRDVRRQPREVPQEVRRQPREVRRQPREVLQEVREEREVADSTRVFALLLKRFLNMQKIHKYIQMYKDVWEIRNSTISPTVRQTTKIRFFRVIGGVMRKPQSVLECWGGYYTRQHTRYYRDVFQDDLPQPILGGWGDHSL